MDLLAAWCGFIGAWVLVAGPMYQGAYELSEIPLDFAAVRVQAQALVPLPRRVSPWWWLLPPAAYLLTVRRQRAWQQQVLRVLTPEQRAGFATFSNKAGGWFVVGAGAALIGIRETAALVETLRWPLWSVPALIVLALALALVFTVSRLHHAQRVLHSGDAAQERAA